MFTAKRIAGDIRLLTKSKSLGIEYDFAYDDKNVEKMYATIYGPEGSCFERCILYYTIDLSQGYPIKPPVFKFITPIRKRFHPNMYADGKVCLTILNTWHDSKVSGWTSATTLEAVLTTIRSMIHDNPLSEEPGQNHNLKNKNAKDYHVAAKYYSLENTFSYFLQDINMPADLFKHMRNYFMSNIEVYRKTIKELQTYDGKHIKYFHGEVTISTQALNICLDNVIEKLESTVADSAKED